MRRLFTFLILCLLAVIEVNGQFYSGKFRSEPKLEDFDHFIVIQHPHHQKYGGTLSVKAFVKSGELWHSKAHLVDNAIADQFIDRFAKDLDILSVYELSIELDGEVWEYFMLGYKNEYEQASFVIVEEIFDDINSDPVEVNTFTWDMVTAKR